MYRIIKIDGTELGITDSVNYIKISANGCFAPTDKENAIGVAFQSTPYNLVGHEDIEGADTVIVSTIDGGAEMYEYIKMMSDRNDALESQLTDTQMALCDSYEQNLVLEEELTNTQLALCEIYEMMEV